MELWKNKKGTDGKIAVAPYKPIISYEGCENGLLLRVYHMALLKTLEI